jgi:hypothetical protein
MPPCETQSPVGLTNKFIFQSRASKHFRFHAKEASLRALLLTPLNSSFNMAGDLVLAHVISPPEGGLGRLLPTGTVLYGMVERSSPAARFQQNGKIMVLFYGARVGNMNFLLDWISDAANTELPQLSLERTKRQKLRGILMTANRLVIPAAIGSGGLSLAITTGTGALIGGVLSENKHYVRGAIRGAWEGAGLTILDPIVQKGSESIFPVGTTLDLKLAHPVDLNVPSYIVERLHIFESTNTALELTRLPRLSNHSRDYLITWARILPRSGIPSQHLVTNFSSDTTNSSTGDQDTKEQLEEVNRYLQRKDLAGAVAAIERAYRANPSSPAIEKTRNKLLQMISSEASVGDSQAP